MLWHSLLLSVLVGEELACCLEQMRFGDIVVDTNVLAPLKGHGVWRLVVVHVVRRFLVHCLRLEGQS